jgi:hypothetical protein
MLNDPHNNLRTLLAGERSSFSQRPETVEAQLWKMCRDDGITLPAQKSDAGEAIVARLERPAVLMALRDKEKKERGRYLTFNDARNATAKRKRVSDQCTSCVVWCVCDLALSPQNKRPK